MPLFFIVSGFLWSKRPFEDTLKRRFKSLIAPCCFLTIYILFMFLLLLLGDKDISIVETLIAICFFPKDMSAIRYFAPLWFLPYMFITDVLYMVISNYCRSLKGKGSAVILLACIGSLYSMSDFSRLPFL